MKNSFYRSLIFLAVLHCLVFSEKLLAHEGWGIVIDKSGQIYFTDIPTNTIWKINREGRLQVALHNQHSHALIKGSDGSIYGTHENGRVWKISSGGHYTEILGPSYSLSLNLHCFTIDINGNIYSMNAKSVQTGQVMLLKRSADGKVTTVAGGNRGYQDGQGSEAQFMSIDGIAWGADSSLYLTDGPYVRNVTTEGVVSTIGGKLTRESWGEDLMGLTVLSNGDLLIADYSGRRILKITKEKNIQTILQSRTIWSPSGVTVFEEELYIFEHLRMPFVLMGNIGIGPYIRIRKLAADSTITTLTTVWGRNTNIFGFGLMGIIFLSLLFKFFRSENKREPTAQNSTAKK